MSKILTVIFLCSGITLYAQNPSKKNEFDKNVDRAHKLYDGLTQEEKKFCDLGIRDLAVQHARSLRDSKRAGLIPAEIDPNEELTMIASKYQACLANLHFSGGYTKERKDLLTRISVIRMMNLWQKKADSVGKHNTFNLVWDRAYSDPNYWAVNNLKEANELYKMLTPDEQAYCDLIYREEAVEHARQLTYIEKRKSFVPVTISPHEDLPFLRSQKRELCDKLKLSDTEEDIIFQISARRMTALWKKKADLVGGKTSWRLAKNEVFEDSND